MPLYSQETYFDMIGLLFQSKHFATWTMSPVDALKTIYDHMKTNL